MTYSFEGSGESGQKIQRVTDKGSLVSRDGEADQLPFAAESVTPEQPISTGSTEATSATLRTEVRGAISKVSTSGRDVTLDLTRFVDSIQRILVKSTARRYWPLIFFIALYVGWNLHLIWNQWNGYGYPPFDLAIFDQGLWLLTHFHAPFVTIMGRDLFGDHTSFILLLVAPFYRLFPEPMGILVMQTFAIAGASIPIFLIAQKLIKNTTIATLLVAAYLLNPALQQGTLEQFHPEGFQVLIISLAIYAAIESRAVLLGVMVALALLVKEDAAVLIAPLGVWVMFRRNRLWGLRIIVAAVTWGLIANLAIIPSLLGTNSFYATRIPFGGLSGFLGTVFRRPGQLISYLRSDSRGFYVWQLGFSMGWVFLLAPELALLALLVIAENVLSSDPYMHQIIYHYTLAIIPILMIGTVYAVAKQKSERRRYIATAIVVVTAAWSSILWGLTPFADHSTYALWAPGSPTVNAVNALEAKIPANAVVSAWYPLASHLHHRTQIYVWPTPFSASNWGLGTNTGARLPVSSQVQYLILPEPLDANDHNATFTSLSTYFHLISSASGIGLYQRDQTP